MPWECQYGQTHQVYEQFENKTGYIEGIDSDTYLVFVSDWRGVDHVFGDPCSTLEEARNVLDYEIYGDREITEN